MAKQVDAEKAIDNLKNAKFGLSIQNIIALVTVLSSLIAGWYTFTGRIDSLEAVVQGFADASDIELVGQKLEDFEKRIDYLTEKIDSYEGVDLSDIKSDINGLKRDMRDIKKEVEQLNDDPLKRFNN
tara:strand:+ start:1442 stop:1822 length:381 start_codon:yes stop_codon:yes gene_type:complete